MGDNADNWWSDSLAYAARTDVGMRRSNNQDSHRVEPASTPRLWSSRGHIFVVADGMGAHAAGEYASELASTIVPQSYLKRTNQSTGDSLRDAILEAHETIRKRGESDEAFHDMGTTCDALVLKPEGAYIGHVGDSRVYRLRNRTLEQLTFDHSLVWEVKYRLSSNPNYKQAPNVPKNVITRSLGPTDNLVVALEGPFPLEPGDVFLLCSDGLSGQVEDSVIGQTLATLQPDEASEALVNLANLNGGPDNITVVVARIKSAPNLEENDRDLDKANKLYEKRQLNSGAKASLFGGIATLVLALLALFSSEYRAFLATVFGALTLILGGAFCCFARKTLFGKKMNGNDGKILGKGPYTRTSAEPSEDFCRYAARACKELCDIIQAQSNLFAPDWNGIRSAQEQARAFFQQGNFAGALRANLSVVNYIMRELKKARPHKR